VVLIDPQYAPKVLVKSETPGMVDQIATAAKEENVDLFKRFAVMRNWFEVQHLPFDTFVSPDGLHMNDWGYACVAKLLANGIAEAATRPVASAHARCLSCPAKAGHPVITALAVCTPRAPFRFWRLLDRPPEPVIGPATSGRTRWRTMTAFTPPRVPRAHPRRYRRDVRDRPRAAPVRR
jgi:hypothetical protein